MGLGAKFGQRMTEKTKLKFQCLFLGMIATKVCVSTALPKDAKCEVAKGFVCDAGAGLAMPGEQLWESSVEPV